VRDLAAEDELATEPVSSGDRLLDETYNFVLDNRNFALLIAMAALAGMVVGIAL
jgi:hypothetical protein